MLKSDQVLWERELAAHLQLHGTDLLKLPALEPATRMSRRRRRWLTALLLWTPVALVGTTIGWSVGWYVI
ncbi:MAG TPA: hypothetical protein VGJ13_09420 [Pseudonocardiaceae bacterium]|jgi:ferric-dicitrate binding protein FerR (iron transport regulator)